MWYAKYTEPRTIELRPLQRPKLRSPDDLLIRVAYAGICDNDLLIYAMNERSLEWPGLAPTEGHEFSGIVLEAGENEAVNFRPGDRVSGLAWSFCDNCYYCKNGMESHCVNQTVTSTFATELVLNQRQMCRLPSSVSLKDGVFTDPITYCLHTSLHHIAHPPYPNVLIFGTTAMALITLQLAKLQGAATVVVVEQNVEKAALARSLGAGQVIDPHGAAPACSSGFKGISISADQRGLPLSDAARQREGPAGDHAAGEARNAVRRTPLQCGQKF